MRKRLRILVVDDDDLILESLRSELGEQYEVLCATRASEAMSIFGREEVDCVISDVRMPGTDGITLLKEVGSRNPFVGRVLITAFTDAEATDTALSEKGIFKVAKPWRDELGIAVCRAIEYGKMRVQLERSVRRFDLGLELERLFRNQADPRIVLEHALAFVSRLEHVQRAEILVRGEGSCATVACASHNEVTFSESARVPERIALVDQKARIERQGAVWHYCVPLWEVEEEGEWVLRGVMHKLLQDELAWMDFVAERLVETMERLALVREIKQNRRSMETHQGQLVNLDRMASLGFLMSGVMHELSTPVGYVSSNVGILDSSLGEMAELLQQWEKGLETSGEGRALDSWRALNREKLAPLLKDLRQIAEESSDGMARLLSITGNLKSFIQVDKGGARRVVVEKILEGSLTMVLYKYKHTLTVQRNFRPAADVLGDPGELGQVFLDVLLNAAQAMAGKGVVTVEISQEDGWVRVSIGDRGPGMPTEVLPLVFDPLFTTKKGSDGTGLGLTITRELLAKHGGTIELTSVVGQGTTAILLLPALEDVASA